MCAEVGPWIKKKRMEVGVYSASVPGWRFFSLCFFAHSQSANATLRRFRHRAWQLPRKDPYYSILTEQNSSHGHVLGVV